jgi:HSP20 family protein
MSAADPGILAEGQTMSEKKTVKAKSKPVKVKNTKAVAEQTPVVRLVDQLSDTFDELEKRIRERAYHIFLERNAGDDDPVADWLDAQMEMVGLVTLDVKEQKKNIVVETNLKGFTPKDVEVEIDGRQLKVFGSRTETKNASHGEGSQTCESSMHFYQSVTLPRSVDAEASEAKLLKNGKLKVILPLAKH